VVGGDLMRSAKVVFLMVRRKSLVAYVVVRSFRRRGVRL